MSLIGENALQWGERILGDDKNKDYPARIFLNKLIDEHIPQYSFIKALMLPECPVGWILENIDSYAELSGAERVDFYLAEANLVIEVDGSSHNEKKQKIRDNVRDILLLKNKTQTIRVPTTAIRENAAQIIQIFKEIEGELINPNSWPHSKSSLLQKNINIRIFILIWLQLPAFRELLQPRWRHNSYR